jgi:DNA-binding MarR family transcriptional regulator
MEFRRSAFLKMLQALKSMRISALFSEDISFPEYGLLGLIVDIETETESVGVWESDIVKRVNMTPQAVSKFIQLASRKGYIERYENENDRRSTGLRITDHGRAVLLKTDEELNVFYNSVSDEFSDEEKAAVHRLMNKLYTVMQENYLKFKIK